MKTPGSPVKPDSIGHSDPFLRRRARPVRRGPWINWQQASMRGKEHAGTKRGFTSIELLAVIGILTILLTVFLPALAQSKGRASAVCRNNLRQIGLGFMMYAQDHADTLVGWGWEFHDPAYAYPSDRQISGGEKQADFTTGKLWGYAGKSPLVFRCPAYALRTPSNPKFWGFNSTTPPLPYPLWSYAANATASQSCRPSTDNSFDLRIDTLHTPPATTLLVLEVDDSQYDNGVALFEGNLQPETQDHLGTRYHGDVGNLAFMDGHAVGMTWSQYTNACSGMEKAKQFFGGSYNFRW